MTPPTLTIRPFHPDDQAAARRLILGGLGEHFGFIDASLNPDLDDIWQNYVLAGATFAVAEVDGERVGTGALVAEAAGDLATGRMVRVSVSAEYRRLGIGRRLVNYLVEAARRRGYRQLLVETNHDWHDAIRLYQACGFTEYGRDEESVYLRRKLG
ncbi:MAG TPA: GNAT family N-acetyltransferase [Anaerolineae bacterium]